MIRWLFLVLIVLNLGVFAWGMQRELRPVAGPLDADAGVPTLVLTSELEPDKQTVDSPAPESVVAPVRDPVPAQEAPVPFESEAEGAGTEVDAQTEGGLPEAEPVGVSSPEPQSPALEANTVCYSLGVLQKRSQAESLLAQAVSQGLTGRVRQSAEERQVGYWVLIPPLASPEAAAAKVEQLKSKGVTDVWRFTKGDLANGISLGLFARETQARSHQQDLQRKGVSSVARPRFVEQASYWVDLSLDTDPEIAAQMVNRFSGDDAALRSEIIECRP